MTTRSLTQKDVTFPAASVILTADCSELLHTCVNGHIQAQSGSNLCRKYLLTLLRWCTCHYALGILTGSPMRGWLHQQAHSSVRVGKEGTAHMGVPRVWGCQSRITVTISIKKYCKNCFSFWKGCKKPVNVRWAVNVVNFDICFVPSGNHYRIV